MVKLECDNNITIISGDTLFLNFRLANRKLSKGDSVIMTVKDKEGQHNLFQAQTNEFDEKGVACFDITNAQTAQEVGTYDYNIRVITHDGVDEIVIKGKFNIIN